VFGDEIVKASAVVVPTGIAITSTLGSVTTTSDNNIEVTGFAGTTGLGSVTLIAKAVVAITGLEALGKIKTVNVWGLVNDAQTPSYSDVSTTQTPNWKEVA
jgi:hypothetical protein